MDHTPGPWRAAGGDKQYVVTNVGEGLAIVAQAEFMGIGRTTSHANARLMAAAPEMLDLLVEFVDGNYVDRDFLYTFRGEAKRLIEKINQEASEC